MFTKAAVIAAIIASVTTPMAAGDTGNAAGSAGMIGVWSAMERVQTDPEMTNLTANLVIIGDSITVATGPALAEQLKTRGWNVRLDANSSMPTMVGVERFKEYMDARRAAGTGYPRTVVAALGSNDTVTGTYQGPQKIQGQIERLRSLMGPGRLVWVNVYTNSVYKASRAQGVTLPNARIVNAKILAAKNRATGRPAVTRVVDWYSFIARSPYRQRAYLRDGVHTTALGTAARNALIKAYV